MKRLFAAFALFIAAIAFRPVFGGPGDGCHFHGSKSAADSVVAKCADQRKELLVKNGKIDGSWGSIKYESISMIDGQKGKEWRVVYKNPAATDKAKTSLYMFFTPVGNFIAANHTGQ